MNRSASEGASLKDESVPKRRRRWPRWLLICLTAVLALALVAAGTFLFLTRNPNPDAFYEPPSPVPALPGTMIRSEPYTGPLPAGARAWRVLYASTDERGAPVAVSGLIVAPMNPSPGPHPVVAWAHGTTGIVPPCAPSLTSDPFAGVPDMSGPLAQGWALALTDYPGLGTPGIHPYLVGVSEARAVLDSVRAAHLLETGLELDTSYAIWGHSQGGHAALFAGQLAAEYLPEFQLAGIAALAPLTQLADNFSAFKRTDTGNLLTIFTVHSWSEYYDDVSDGVLAPSARTAAGVIADSCYNQPSALRIDVAGLTLPQDVTTVDIAHDPSWNAHMSANSPDPVGVTSPLFVAQGMKDVIVAPSVTGSWVAARCAAGAQVDYRAYADLTHNNIVDQGAVDALTWTIDRFSGKPNASGLSCLQDDEPA